MIAAVVVHCDACRTERTVPGSTLATARRALAGRGWRQPRRNGRPVDVCPRCMIEGHRWAA